MDNYFIFSSHCLLNQRVRAGNSYTPGATQKFLTLLGRYPIYLYQLPCPEYTFLGDREKKTQDQWEKIEGFKDFCKKLALEVKKRCQEITKGKTPLLIAIARSPCCSASLVYRGRSLVKGKGIWLQELEKNLRFDIIEFDFKKVEDSIEKIKAFLNQKIGHIEIET